MKFEPIRVSGVVREDAKILSVMPAICQVGFVLDPTPSARWFGMLAEDLVGPEDSQWTVDFASRLVTVRCPLEDLDSSHLWLTNRVAATNGAFLNEHGDLINAQRELDKKLDELSAMGPEE